MKQNKNFGSYSHYYNLLNNDKNYAIEVEYICNLLKTNNATGHEILEFGSGTGIHAKMLANKGFNVLGVELSPDMVKESIAIDGFSCIEGDIRNIRLGRQFDVVLSLFHVISYQVTNEDLNSSFKTAALHLKKGGLFVFDAWYSPAVYAQKPGIRVKHKEDGSLNIIRVSEPVIYNENNQVDVKFKMYINDSSAMSFDYFEEVHSMRHFSIPEIALIANYSGFKLIKSEEFITSDMPSSNTWGVCFVLQKQND